MNKKIVALTLTIFTGSLWPASEIKAQKNVADEVVWMVGGEPILLSDIEFQKLRLRSEGVRFDGNPDCFIPEQIAVQKLFLNQAKIDSVEVGEQQVNRYVDMWVENAIAQVGSKEKLEEYFNKKLSQIKEDERIQIRNNEIVRAMQQNITRNVQVSPSEIRQFFSTIPADSLPFIPKMVEVEKISIKPKINLAEIDRIKARLREYAEQINNGTQEFTTLARLYSEDNRTAIQGGEYGFVGKASLEPEFANVVFNLSDPKRASQIIKTEEGYHIVQLVEKRGDMVNFRHILMRPVPNSDALTEATLRLDSICNYINEGKLSFAQAAEAYSDDKDTHNNGGLMTNRNQESEFEGSASFRYEDLPQDIAKVAYELKQGEISKPFVQRLPNGQQEVVVIRLKAVHEEHLANMNTDFRTIKAMALAQKRERVIDEWIRRKQQETPIVIRSHYADCTFRYPGWVRKKE